MLSGGFIVFLAVLAYFAPFASSHSWLECTDYKATSLKQLKDYHKSACHGNARCGDRQAKYKFGHDTGFDHKSNGKCQCGFSESKNNQIQIAEYNPGQKVCLAYPAKNHVAETCTNKYIPDNDVVISRTAVNDRMDSFIKTYPHLNGKHKKGVIDMKGFQNCPNFCSNPDKALCTMCFNLENDLKPGRYTFRWVWQFGVGEFYTSCWEANVKKGKSTTNKPTPATTATSSKDGSQSDNKDGSESDCMDSKDGSDSDCMQSEGGSSDSDCLDSEDDSDSDCMETKENE